MSKKIKILMFAMILGTVIFTSCKKDPPPAPDPVANFTYTGADVEAPVNVSFSNTSENATSYSWDFGDGKTSTEKNPTHTYTNETGSVINRTVVLIAKNDEGKSANISKELAIKSTVLIQPVANFTYEIIGDFAPARVEFSNTSTDATSYSWDFGDGSSSTETSPEHIYTAGGTYTVELTSINENGTNKKTTTVNINAKPSKIKITGLNLIDIPFTDGSGNSWDADCDGTGPDVMFKIFDDDDNLFFTSGYYPDITTSTLPQSFSSGLPITLSDLSYEFIIGIFDRDTGVCGDDDFIGGYYFTPNDMTPTDGSEYPTSIHFESSTSDVVFDLEVEWVQ